MIHLQCMVAILLSQLIYRVANVATVIFTQVDQYYYLKFLSCVNIQTILNLLGLP